MILPIECFKEEFARCTRCFIMYCEDNADEDGNIDMAVVEDAIEEFISNIEMAQKCILGEFKYEDN